MAEKKNADTRDVFDKALEDYWPEGVAVGSALAGRAVGRRGARKFIDDVMSGKRKLNPRNELDAEDIAQLKTQAGREKYVRDSGRGAAVGFGMLPSALPLGKYIAQEAAKPRNRK